jgi:hypothetical protein
MVKIRSRPIWLLIILTLLVAVLYGRPNSMQRIANGSWGGQGIHLEVNEKSAKVEFDCAHGAIQGPLAIDGKGAFSLKGTFTRERGGPVRSDEKESGESAIYSGTIKGQTMTLEVRLEGQDQPLVSFELTQGKTGRLRKCL